MLGKGQAITIMHERFSNFMGFKMVIIIQNFPSKPIAKMICLLSNNLSIITRNRKRIIPLINNNKKNRRILLLMTHLLFSHNNLK